LRHPSPRVHGIADGRSFDLPFAKGKKAMSWELIVRQKFAAAHFLKNYRGKCERMHGHTFEMEVHFDVRTLDKAGISIDFTRIKEYLKEIVPDHRVLNEIYDFSPSAENLARHFFEQIQKEFPVSRVIIWESEDAGAAYAGDQ
jgi:6-pyruvoyltetrahydropterin/6-carboxytetrahydropterin synthase